MKKQVNHPILVCFYQSELFYCGSCYTGLVVHITIAILFQVSYRASLLHQKSQTYGDVNVKYIGLQIKHYGKSVVQENKYLLPDNLPL